MPYAKLCYINVQIVYLGEVNHVYSMHLTDINLLVCNKMLSALIDMFAMRSISISVP